jgi:hypothetical protein
MAEIGEQKITITLDIDEVKAMHFAHGKLSKNDFEGDGRLHEASTRLYQCASELLHEPCDQ